VAAEERKLAAGGGIDATESERTAAFLATRVANGLETLKGIGSGGDATLGTRIAENLPFGLGNYAISEDRQRAATAQLDVLDAALTLGTGAAYTKEQIEGYRQSYFPQPGDGDDVIADKSARLKVLLEAARVKAGAAAPAIDRALANAGTDALAGAAKEETAPGDRNALISATRRADGQYDLVWGDGRKQVSDSIPMASSVTADIEPPPTDEERNSALGTVDAVVRGIADTVTLGYADEIAAAGNTLFGGGTYDQQLARERGIDRQDERVNPYARLGGQIAGGFALPTGTATGARGLARIGALYGAGYGSGSAEGSTTDRLIGAARGGATGALVGGGLGAIGSRFAGRGGGGGPNGGGASAQDLATAAQQEGVRVSRPIVDPTARPRMAYLESSIGGSGRVREGLQNTRDDLEARVTSLGDGGTVQSPGIIGQRVQDAAVGADKAARNVARRDYERAAKIAPGARVTATEAVGTIDGHIQRLSGNANSNKPMIEFLENVKADFVGPDGLPRAKTIEEIRDLRTSLNDEISRSNLSRTRAETLVEDVVNAASQDITRELGQQSPKALALWQRGDKKWAQYKTDQKQLTSLVLGRADDPVSGEAVFNRLRTMVSQKGDADKVQRLFDKLPDDLKRDYVATVAESLGRRAPDEDFSPALLVSAARGFSDEAAQTIFGPDGARSIKNLKMLAEAYKSTTGALNNTRSGMVANWANFFRDIVGGGFIGTMLGGPVGGATGIALGATSAALTAGARNLSAKALMNPDMSRWLAAAPRAASGGAISRHIGRLDEIAKKNPAIAQNVIQLKDAIVQTVRGGGQQAAAQDTQSGQR
jgi:hypothetical protein